MPRGNPHVVRGRSEGAAGGCAVRGNSRSYPTVAAGDEGARGNPRTHRRQCRKMRCAGQLADASKARRLGGVAVARMRGNPEIHRLRAEGPKGRRIGDSRRLEAPSPVQRKDAGCEETRECIGKLNGTMFDPSTCEFIAIEASEIPESLTPLFFWLTAASHTTANNFEQVRPWPLHCTMRLPISTNLHSAIFAVSGRCAYARSASDHTWR
jgi:hypothetical protein